MIPLAIAIFGGVKKSTIYGFDMFSDVKVKAHPDQEIVIAIQQASPNLFGKLGQTSQGTLGQKVIAL